MSRGMKGAMERGWCDGRGNCGSTEPLWLLESVAASDCFSLIFRGLFHDCSYNQFDLQKPAAAPTDCAQKVLACRVPHVRIPDCM